MAESDERRAIYRAAKAGRPRPDLDVADPRSPYFGGHPEQSVEPGEKESNTTTSVEHPEPLRTRHPGDFDWPPQHPETGEREGELHMAKAMLREAEDRCVAMAVSSDDAADVSSLIAQALSLLPSAAEPLQDGGERERHSIEQARLRAYRQWEQAHEEAAPVMDEFAKLLVTYGYRAALAQHPHQDVERALKGLADWVEYGLDLSDEYSIEGQGDAIVGCPRPVRVWVDGRERLDAARAALASSPDEGGER